MSDPLWAAVEDRIAEIARRILRQEIEKERPTSQTVQTDWMTEEELADYGKVTIHAIRKWTARPSDEHPLPCGHMGTLRRYHRKAIDQWMWEEDELERLKRREKGLRLLN